MSKTEALIRQGKEIVRLRAELAEIKAQRPGLVDAVVAQQKRAEEAEAAIARVRDWAAHIGYTHEWGMIQDEFFGALGGES